MTRLNTLLAAAVVAVAGLAGTQAHAVALSPSVQLMVGSTLITDNGAGDNAAATGVINYVAAAGPFSITINTGVANNTPYLDLASQEISSSAPGTLVIKFTATNLTNPTAAANFLSMFSGNIAGGSASAQLQSYYDASNTAFGTSTALANLSSSNATFALNSSNAGGGTTPFSLTEVITINAGGAGRNFSLDASLSAVPEPMSISLLGASLAGLGLVRLRRQG